MMLICSSHVHSMYHMLQLLLCRGKSACKTMNLLNFSVYYISTTTLLPWKVVECPVPTFTFKQF